MKRFFSYRKGLLLLIVSSMIFIMCAKEYSYEGGATGSGSSTGSAVYTMVGAGGACLGSAVNGNYTTGTALDAGNTVVLQVDVSTPGTYSITTAAQDGFSFSGSGTFTTTGAQTVTLTGNGTPAAAGSFSFSTPASSICSFTVTVTTPVGGYTLAGSPGTCQDYKVTFTPHPGKALDQYSTVDISVNVATLGAYSITTDTLDGISFSATGSFTKTGTQVVSLVGAGTPQYARNLHFTVTTSSGATSCGFDVAVVDNLPLATYVIESGGGGFSSCIATVSGTYTAGIALGASNTVSTRVSVINVGNYTISTSTINGIQFAHSGTFTSTGAQMVTLEGSGTPIAAGTFTFQPTIVGPAPLGGAGCNLTLTVN